MTEFIEKYNVEVTEPEPETKLMSMDEFIDLSRNYDLKKIEKEELEGGLNGFGIILKNVFSRKECQKILEETEKVGYGYLGKGNTGNAYRGNKRNQLHDTSGKLGEEIWRRISPFIPSSEEIPDDGKFVFSHMNPRYRFAKYYAGNGFALHVDKPTVFVRKKFFFFFD